MLTFASCSNSPVPPEKEKHGFSKIQEWAPKLSEDQYDQLQSAHITEQLQKESTTPYLKGYSDKLSHMLTAKDYEKFRMRHITEDDIDFIRNGIGQAEAEAEGEAKHAPEDTTNHFEYAYIHWRAYDWLLGLKDSLNSFGAG